MDITQLEAAALRCLAAHDSRYNGAEIVATNPIPGGYSRLTYFFKVACPSGNVDVILQYLPVGATGLVRIDRRTENDLLQHLTGLSGINAAKLITSDVEQTYFDSPAYLFNAEPGESFVNTCREADSSEHAAFNRVVARVAAQTHNLNINDIPQSFVRPDSWSDYLDQQIELFRQTEAESKSPRPFLRYLARWLDENRPPEAPLTLVHGDLQISNMISIPSDQNSAVLVDWELAHIGDPREDLGWFTMVCGAIPPDILSADVDGFYQEYREKTGLSEAVINPATVAYFLVISSIKTHSGMLKSSDALVDSPEQAQSALAAYYANITTYQHINWMNSIRVVEEHQGVGA